MSLSTIYFIGWAYCTLKFMLDEFPPRERFGRTLVASMCFAIGWPLWLLVHLIP